MKQLQESPAWQVKVCKLADLYDNLLDLGTNDPKKRTRTFRNARRYLDAVKSDAPEVDHPWKLVSDLLARIKAQDSDGAGGA